MNRGIEQLPLQLLSMQGQQTPRRVAAYIRPCHHLLGGRGCAPLFAHEESVEALLHRYPLPPDRC